MNIREALKKKLSKAELEIMPRAFEIIGSIAILQLPRKLRKKEKLIARTLLGLHKNIKTVVKKTARVKGRLRTLEVKHIAGIKTKETLHKENGCVMALDIEKCYFSSRLAHERLEIAKIIASASKAKTRKTARTARQIKKTRKIIVLFGGVGPFALVIARLNKDAEIYSVELNRIAASYAEKNIELNKLKNIKAVQGNVKKIKKIIRKYGLPKFYDIIVMPRPQLKETFLKEAFSIAKPKALFFYYDFGPEKEKILQKITQEAKKARKKIKILQIKKAGEIAPYKYRWRIDFRLI